MKYKNRIILALEGIDGAGKTTLCNELSNFFGSNIVFYKRTEKGKIIDKIVKSQFMQNHYMLQIPIYLLLSYKNFFLFKRKDYNNQVIVMDRCFLSNICYFFPKSLFDNKLLKKLLWFEVKLYPQIIFILDVEPTIGQARDSNKKALAWLINTRNAYLNTAKSTIADLTTVQIIEDNLSIENKANIIIKYIQGEIKNGN